MQLCYNIKRQPGYSTTCHWGKLLLYHLSKFSNIWKYLFCTFKVRLLETVSRNFEQRGLRHFYQVIFSWEMLGGWFKILGLHPAVNGNWPFLEHWLNRDLLHLAWPAMGNLSENISSEWGVWVRAQSIKGDLIKVSARKRRCKDVNLPPPLFFSPNSYTLHMSHVHGLFLFHAAMGLLR